MLELKDTVTFMNSDNYKDRFQAEYLQTKIRYEKLKAFNNKIEAASRTDYMTNKVEMPAHDCPTDILREQQSIMGQYLHLLEVRAVIEGISLDGIDKDYIQKCEEASRYILPTGPLKEYDSTITTAKSNCAINSVEVKKL